MDIGLMHVTPNSTADPAKVAKRAEELGFESYWVGDHTIVPVHSSIEYPGAKHGGKEPYYVSQLPDPLIALARAGATTSRIKLGTGICLVPERDPIMLAKEVATLDFYSGGRFIFGIGAGWLADETEIMGVEFKKRWEVTQEYVMAMKALWTQTESSFSGQYVRFPKVKSYPKPLQKPHPPIHLGAGGFGPNLRALKMTVAYGDGWAPLGLSPEQLAAELARLRQLCAEAGRDYAKMEISIYTDAGAGVSAHQVSDEAARKMVREYEEAGAHRMIFLARQSGNEFLTDLEQMARRFIAPA